MVQTIFNNTKMISSNLNDEKTFREVDLAETTHNTARNGANCYKAGNDENNSNPKVEIFSSRIIFSLIFTLANRGEQ